MLRYSYNIRGISRTDMLVKVFRVLYTSSWITFLDMIRKPVPFNPRPIMSETTLTYSICKLQPLKKHSTTLSEAIKELCVVRTKSFPSCSWSHAMKDMHQCPNLRWNYAAGEYRYCLCSYKVNLTLSWAKPIITVHMLCKKKVLCVAGKRSL